MPTTLPRHTITETPPVREALEALRSTLGEGEKIDFGELVALGARVKARRLTAEGEVKRAARKRIADMVRTRSFPYEMDVAAADDVKRLGLIAAYE